MDKFTLQHKYIKIINKKTVKQIKLTFISFNLIVDCDNAVNNSVFSFFKLSYWLLLTSECDDKEIGDLFFISLFLWKKR